jgi:hypothetical protein
MARRRWQRRGRLAQPADRGRRQRGRVVQRDRDPLQGITAARPGGLTVSYNDGSSDSSAAALAASSSVAVVFASSNESEGSDLGSIDLSSASNSLISAAAQPAVGQVPR